MAGLAARLEASDIPQELRAIPQWVCWRLELKPNTKKPSKIPINSATGARAKSTNRADWGTWERAIERLRADETLSGVGFVFTSDDPYCGLDWDECYHEDGYVKKLQADQIRAFRSYGERSQSGTGAHVIIKGSLPPEGRRKSGIEMYDRDRFFAVTGDRLPFCPKAVEHRQAELDALHAAVFKTNRKVTATLDVVVGDLTLDPAASPPLDLWEALCENDPKFKKAWLRKRTDFTDQSPSVYDQSMATRAAQASWTDQQIVDLLIASRRKHGDDLKLRQDYYQRTIRQARASAAGDHAELLRVEMGVESAAHAEEMTVEQTLEALSKKLGLEGASAIVRIARVKTEPGTYRIFLQDGSTIDLGGIDGLREQNKFASRIADCARKEIRHMSPPQWRAFRDLFYDVMEDIDPGDEGSPLRDFALLILAHLENTPPVAGDDWRTAACNYSPVMLDGLICVTIRGLNRHKMAQGLKQDDTRKIASQLSLSGWVLKLTCFRLEGKVIKRNYWARDEKDLGFVETCHL